MTTTELPTGPTNKQDIARYESHLPSFQEGLRAAVKRMVDGGSSPAQAWRLHLDRAQLGVGPVPTAKTAYRLNLAQHMRAWSRIRALALYDLGREPDGETLTVMEAWRRAIAEAEAFQDQIDEYLIGHHLGGDKAWGWDRFDFPHEETPTSLLGVTLPPPTRVDNPDETPERCYGLSYKTIGRQLGISARSAEAESNKPAASLQEALADIAEKLSEHDAARQLLMEQRDELIEEVTAAGVGATTVARLAKLTPAAVYKILGKQA